MKRILSAVISVLMVCLAMPVAVSAISYPIPSIGNVNDLIIDSNGDLYLGFEQLTDTVTIGDSGIMSFEVIDSVPTLTLENVHFSTEGRYALDIQCQSDLTINLIGTNSITSTYNEASSYGIAFDYGLNFTGTGSLTVTGGSTDNSYGLASEYNYPVTVSGCTVTVRGGDARVISLGLSTDGDITVSDGGSLVVSSGSGIGSNAVQFHGGKKNITVDNGYFSAVAGNGTTSSYGISNTDVTVRNGGRVEISGETAAGYNSTLTDGEGNTYDLSGTSVTLTTDPEPEPDDPEPNPKNTTDTAAPPVTSAPTYAPSNDPPAIPEFSLITQEAKNIDVIAILNKSGSVDSAKTRLEVLRAARTKGVTQITLILPENCKGISAKAIQKCLKAAGDKKLYLSYGDVTIRLTDKSKQILTGV
ncbi:MAG: hypothetical protein LBM41_00810 [Ruminococcus sp.]|nr:hypothetical protein [Ruminococcus sp.]